MKLRTLVPILLGWVWSGTASAVVDIFVSVPPLEYLSQRVGGEQVKVESMVRPGHNPVTYEPTPRQMTSLSGADAFFRVGVPFETLWLGPILKANPGVTVIDVREGIELAPLVSRHLWSHEGEGDDHRHDHPDMDPHVWLDPARAGVIARTIMEYLIEADPQNEQAFRANTESLLQDLMRLDQDIRKLLDGTPSRKFLVFHPAWGYFADAYGLEQIAVEHEGKEPGPKKLSLLIDLIRSEQINTVFAQEQFGSQVTATLADEISGRVVVLDPLSGDYVSNLLRAAAAIAGSE